MMTITTLKNILIGGIIIIVICVCLLIGMVIKENKDNLDEK